VEQYSFRVWDSTPPLVRSSDRSTDRDKEGVECLKSEGANKPKFREMQNQFEFEQVERTGVVFPFTADFGKEMRAEGFS
jgi:hypothetical protein